MIYFNIMLLFKYIHDIQIIYWSYCLTICLSITTYVKMFIPFHICCNILDPNLDIFDNFGCWSK